MTQATISRAQMILRTTSSFCEALRGPEQPLVLLHNHFIPTCPRITEHGPSWARNRLPFIGKTFTGMSECSEYFTLLTTTLTMDMTKDAFPAPDKGGFVVDEKATVEGEEGEGVVTVVGKGRFESKKTGKGWDEVFTYRFSGFDEEGRIAHWEIWADPLSAWVAVGGEDVK